MSFLHLIPTQFTDNGRISSGLTLIAGRHSFNRMVSFTSAQRMKSISHIECDRYCYLCKLNKSRQSKKCTRLSFAPLQKKSCCASWDSSNPSRPLSRPITNLNDEIQYKVLKETFIPTTVPYVPPKHIMHSEELEVPGCKYYHKGPWLFVEASLI